MKIVYFSPYSAIWLHAIPEALTAKSLQDKGHDIIYVSCGKLFEKGCISMSIYGIDAHASAKKRAKICEICTARKNDIVNKFSFENYDLTNYIDESDRNSVNSILSHLEFLDFSLEWDGIRLGRVALYNVILVHKKINLVFSREEWGDYLVDLRHTLYAYIAAKKILQRENPEAVVIYNTRYPTNNAFRLAAKKQGITPYFIHAGSNLKHRLSTLQFGKDDHGYIMGSLLNEWDSFKKIPSDPKSIRLVFDHFMALCNGNSPFIFSKPSKFNYQKLINYFGIKKNKKICVAVLSSSDEHYAQFVFENFLPPRLETLPFESQEKWCAQLIEYFKQQPELFLIIRIHPRIVPNQRNNRSSDCISLFENIFKDLPENVKINWPKDKISLYDLANIADLFLNAWSSVGKEMGLLGIPVLSYGHSWLLYPFDLNYIGGTKEAYFNMIPQAIEEGWSFERVRKTFRWYILEQVYALIDISDSFNFDESVSHTFAHRVLRKIKRTINPHYLSDQSLKSNTLGEQTSTKLHNIVIKNLDTPLDLINVSDLSMGNIDLETREITAMLQKMITAIGGYGPFALGNLARNFNAYINHKTKEVV